MSQSFTNSPLSYTNTNITLDDVLELWKKDIFLNLNCHALGTVQIFNSVTQKVTVTINYKKTYIKSDPLTGLYNQTLVDYPILLDCPIVIMQGGGASLTFPIATGDTCLILFNDRDIDAWLSSGQIGPVATLRLHSFADGIALIGVRPTIKPVLPYDGSRAVLQNLLTKVAVGTTKVQIQNAAFNLNTLLQNLVTEIKSLVTQTAAITVTCAAPGNPSSPPINAAAITAISATLTATATQIAGLLE